MKQRTAVVFESILTQLALQHVNESPTLLVNKSAQRSAVSLYTASKFVNGSVSMSLTLDAPTFGPRFHSGVDL